MSAISKFSCFVTGTDTGIGKTLVSGAIIHALARQGVRAAGMKPVAAGAVLRAGYWHNDDADALAAASSAVLPPDLATPYLLKTAVAPHIAASLEGVTIDFAHILACHRKIAMLADAVVVEGVGGFRVPLTKSLDSADLAVQFGLPVVLVVGMRLGCISQALLTAEAIAARGLRLAGWVANRIDPAFSYLDENVEALRVRLPAPLLGTLTYMASASSMRAADELDFSLLPGWPE